MNLRSYSTTLSIFFLLFLVTLCITPLIGSSDISLARAFSSTLATSNNVDANILFQVRIPRILLGALTGAALSVAGTIFQALLRNDLAAPFTLGVSSGAALGAVIALALNLNFSILGFSIISLFSFGGSLGAIFLVFSLVYYLLTLFLEVYYFIKKNYYVYEFYKKFSKTPFPFSGP